MHKVSSYGAPIRRTSLLVTAVWAGAVLAGCGGGGDGTAQTETTKRLPGGGPCDLVTAAEVAQAVGAGEVEVDPTDEIQCAYGSTSPVSSTNIVRGQDMSRMAGEEKVDLDGVQGTRLDSTESSCGVSVVLSQDDPAQRFAVLSSAVPVDLDKPICEIADEIATTIVTKLPE